MFPKIFSGIKVVDFSRLLPGPFASELLIKMGAEVNCILPPDSDPILGAYSPFEKLKEGKNFLTLDLKKPTDLEEAKTLLKSSSILLEGFRPGTMEKLGLGFEAAKALQPEILYVSVTGYGENHPKYLKGAHDLNFLIDSGIYSLLFSDRSEEIPAIQLADVIGGFYAAFRILMEWIQRAAKPGARHLVVSIVEGLKRMGEYLQDPETPALLPMLTGGMARYHIYRTVDGHRVMVAAIEQKFFDNLLSALGINTTEGEGEEKLIQKIEASLGSKTLEECQKLLQGVDACISFIPSRKEVLTKF